MKPWRGESISPYLRQQEERKMAVTSLGKGLGEERTLASGNSIKLYGTPKVDDKVTYNKKGR